MKLMTLYSHDFMSLSPCSCSPAISVVLSHQYNYNKKAAIEAGLTEVNAEVTAKFISRLGGSVVYCH